MIRHIYTLRADLRKKHIYIWDASNRAAWIFSRLACRLVDISGFVTVEERFIGMSFMNRPIVSLHEFMDDPDAVMIYDQYAGRRAVGPALETGRAIAYADALEPDPRLLSARPFVYGTGIHAWTLLKKFEQRSCRIRGFLLSKMDGPESILGLPVRQFDEAGLTGRDTIVVAVHEERMACEILDYVQKQGFRGTVYIPDLLPYTDLVGTDPFLMLDDAVKAGKRVLLCCEDDMSRALLHEMFALYGIPVSREVCLEGDRKKGLEDIYALADEDPEKSVLFLHALRDDRRIDLVDAANELGFSGGARTYAAIHKTAYARKYLTRILEYEYDRPGLASIDHSPLGGRPGWAVYGCEEQARKRIMVLGGSTSSELYYQETWVSKLYRILQSRQIPAVIYNGANEMADAAEELQRMCRDIRALKPDIVITMSGVNDQARKDNKFNRWYPETPFSLWCRMESYIRTIAGSEGAECFVFLQPINAGMPDADLREHMMFVHDTMTPGGGFSERTRDDDHYIDLLELFRHREGKFIDCCHYSDEANEEIAQIVFETIKDSL